MKPFGIIFVLLSLLGTTTIASAEAFVPSNNKTYNILNQRGDLGTKDGCLVSTVRTDLGATKGEFALLAYEGEYFLYSVADKKFMYRNPVTDTNGWSDVVLSNENIDAFELEQSTKYASYPVRIKSNGYILNTARQTQKGVCLNTWNNYDEGNHYAFVEVADFDPTEALATLESFFTASPSDPEENINLLFIGNSITAGATLNNASSQAPPAVCRSLVESATGVTTNLYNGGHSGITTLGFLSGRDDFTRVVNAAKTFQRNNGGLIYFSIMLGTNDSACTTTEGAPVSPATYGANIRTIINALIEAVPTCKILLNYPIWYSPNTHNSAKYLQEGLDRLHSYYPILDAIIAEYDQVFAGNRNVWDYFEDNKVLFTAESGNAGTFYLHPNVNGAKRLAEVWAKSLLEIIATDGIKVKSPLKEWNLFQPDNTKKYTIATPRGSYGTKDGVATNTAKSGIGATKGEFAFITHDGLLYLYSVADRKFLYRNPVPYRDDWSNIQLSDSYIEPFKVQYTGVNTNYPYCLTSLGYVANVASGTEKGVVLNTWNTCDAGNQVAIQEVGDFDPAEALQMIQNHFDKQLTVTYQVEDTSGKLLAELTATGMEGDVINEVPENVERRAYTTYAVKEPVTLAKGADNIVKLIATWQLPFEVSPDLNNAHWYNLALRGGVDYVTADNGYKCNTTPTKEEVVTAPYQWAFQGDPYQGIVVYNRSDVTKTLAKVNDKAILSNTVYAWKIEENEKGFLLANTEDGKYINEYGGAGGDLGFWHNASDVGSIFTVSEVGSLKLFNVKLPSGGVMTIYTSSEESANGRAILIIPGGGYGYVAGSSEGADWVPMFNDMGYTAAVLTYTTPPTAPDGPLTQARDAMKYLREHSEECRTSTGLVGVIGFSAGGHLASTVATHTTGDERPAFQILFYPVITMDASYTHAGSRENLLGQNPSAELVTLYSNEKQVTTETPMAYLCWASDDGTVPPRNSTAYVSALRAKGVSVRTKTFPSGGHGFGFKTTYAYHDKMVADLTNWMKTTDAVLTAITPLAPFPVPNPKPEAYYNLAGQRISTPQHGFFVTSGHKHLVK